ncbi:MAG: nuclear transport factor 2 family protein [Acidobacteria bacterium]|jgi:ketosteroid isomerase-like protein|nr:nuclear transport factor 2 family protein [Acidobacteriota bacterium]MBA4183292.1 nuclear transport factor 2 family protein [Acidobacteriota bacterium]
MKNIFVLFVLTFAFAGYAFGECAEADKKALEAFDHAWSEAGDKGDRAALMNTLADDFTGLPAMINKTQSIEGTMRAFERNKVNPQNRDQVSSDIYMIACTPTTATITHRNVVTTKDGTGGKEETFYTRSIHFLEKRKGKWQVVSNANHGLDDFGVLMYMEHDWNNADIKRDVAWFEKNYAADYSGISSRDAKIYTKAEDLAGFKDDKSRTESAELSEMNIRIDGNTAVVTGINHVKGRDDKNQPFDRRVRFTDTFIKRDGRWQVWATQGTRIP